MSAGFILNIIPPWVAYLATTAIVVLSIYLAFYPDLASVRLHEVARDRKPQPGCRTMEVLPMAGLISIRPRTR
jgi:hypothetical protein